MANLIELNYFNKSDDLDDQYFAIGETLLHDFYPSGSSGGDEILIS